MSIVPARAQYSFAKVFGGADDDRPWGVKEASDGFFYLFGYTGSYSSVVSAQNYIAKLSPQGNLEWLKAYDDRSNGDNLGDMIELPNGILFFGGAAQEQLQVVNPRVTLIRPDGSFLLDTILSVGQGHTGSIYSMCNNQEKQLIASIGHATTGNDQWALIFQLTQYNGKRVWYKFIPSTLNFKLKKIFKRKDRNEYLVFGERLVIRLDSMGNQIGGAQSMIEAYQGDDRTIYDITQNEDGTFTSLARIVSDTLKGYYLRKHNDDGLFENFLTKLAPIDSDYVNTITSTKDGGYFIAGRLFYRVDSTGQLLWCKRSRLPKNGETICVKQALDGGFYGCALDFDEETNYNMYAFKTTPDGDINTGLLSINKQTLKAQIMPNPSNGLFTISGEFKQAQVSVSNLLGQELLKTSLYTGATLDASQLNPGLYMLTVTSGNASTVQRISILK